MMKNVFKILQTKFFAIQDLQVMKRKNFKFFWINTQFHQGLKAYLFPNILSSEISLIRKKTTEENTSPERNEDN